MEPATPFATGEKIYNESKKPTKSFGQLLLSLIVMQKTSTLQFILRKFGCDIFNNDENISKNDINCSLLDTLLIENSW